MGVAKGGHIRQLRFPVGDPWTIQPEVGRDFHGVSHAISSPASWGSVGRSGRVRGK